MESVVYGNVEDTEKERQRERERERPTIFAFDVPLCVVFNTEADIQCARFCLENKHVCGQKINASM